MEQSTRLSILEHALADVVERLEELPATRDADSLRALASQYVTEMARWEQHPPEEARRQALLKHVLDLNVDVIRAGARPSSGTAAAAEATGDSDDEYPKAV